MINERDIDPDRTGLFSDTDQDLRGTHKSQSYQLEEQRQVPEPRPEPNPNQLALFD